MFLSKVRISEPTKGFKDAFEYLHRLKANENGEIPLEAVLKAREQVESRRGCKVECSKYYLTLDRNGP